MQARAESANATRERIVGAMVELLLERWYDDVTLRDLAHAAGVALQTIINHFSTKEGVLAATLEDPRLAAAFGGDRYEVPAGDVRLAVDRLVESYERAGDATIRLLALESRLPSLASLLAFGRKSHREWVQTTFPAALEGLGDAELQQRVVLLICATDVYTWQILRRDHNLTREQTAAAIVELVEALHPNAGLAAGAEPRRPQPARKRGGS
jgi:AcrR family transcriptional regulator